MARPFILLTCEHGGRKIPSRFRESFLKAPLETHRGWDIGALKIAKTIKLSIGAPLVYSEISRLLVDLNRSIGRPGHFSEFTPDDHDTIINDYYLPYRKEVESLIESKIRNGFCVYHFSVHSFTPRLNRVTRNCELGLLYDPRRPLEKAVSREIKTALNAAEPELRIRLNYPYAGIADGFPTQLRKSHSPDKYCGVEIEFNQGWIQRGIKGSEIQLFSRLMLEAVNRSASF